MPKSTRSSASTSSTKTAAKSRRATRSTKKAVGAGRNGKRLSSRAVLRDVEPGSTVECTHCGERVKFQAKMRHKQVICNVYAGGRWDRVEHFHAPCYDEAGAPFGEPDTSPPVRLPKSARAAEAAKVQAEKAGTAKAS